MQNALLVSPGTLPPTGAITTHLTSWESRRHSLHSACSPSPRCSPPATTCEWSTSTLRRWKTATWSGRICLYVNQDSAATVTRADRPALQPGAGSRHRGGRIPPRFMKRSRALIISCSMRSRRPSRLSFATWKPGPHGPSIAPRESRHDHDSGSPFRSHRHERVSLDVSAVLAGMPFRLRVL